MKGKYKIFLSILFFSYSVLAQKGDTDNTLLINIVPVSFVSYSNETPLPGGELVNEIYSTLGISFNKRIGYSTHLQVGVEYTFSWNVFSEADIDEVSTRNFQIPIRFKKIFPVDKLNNIGSKSRVTNPTGLGLSIGGYYGFGTIFDRDDGTNLNDYSEIASNSYYGGVASFGYVNEKIELMVEAKQDLTSLTNDFFSEIKPLYIGLRVSFLFLDF